MQEANTVSRSISHSETIQSYKSRYGNGIRIEPRVPVRQRPSMEVRNKNGEFPSHLGEPATIKLTPDHRFLRAIEFSFASAAEALIAIDSYQFQVAALWFGIDLLGSNDVDGFVEAFIDDAQLDNADGLTFYESASRIAKQYGASLHER